MASLRSLSEEERAALMKSKASVEGNASTLNDLSVIVQRKRREGTGVMHGES